MSAPLRAGAALVDVTPPPGLAMAGFAARTESALGAHDPLTARALAVNDTAIVCADVIGLDEESCRRIRDGASLDSDRIIVAALHNHGGPAVMAGRVGGILDQGYLSRLERACVRAIDEAVANQRPAELLFGLGVDPGVARNRRHENGLVDAHLPLLRIRGAGGGWIALLTAYACHPVVLGADNRTWTADYPHFVRSALEERYPGAMALFLAGCAGDANTGHKADDSISLAAKPQRTFTEAERIGARIAESASAVEAKALAGAVVATHVDVALQMERRETEAPEHLAARWREELKSADAARAALLGSWIGWADKIAPQPLSSWPARISCFMWAGLPIVALPGEIFAETGLAIRERLGDPRAVVVGYANGCPGYIPPASEFGRGGYEIDEAHRYYGMPATFAPGSAERLADAVVAAMAKIRSAS